MSQASESTPKKGPSKKLPKNVEHLTGDEIMARVFNKRVAKELKKIAHGTAPKPE